MFDADVGGLPASLCREHQLLPAKSSPHDRTMTLVQENLLQRNKSYSPSSTGRPVELRPMPDSAVVAAAFRDALAACENFHGSLPFEGYIPESADEALERIERGEQPRCCLRPQPTGSQWQLMDDIRSKYDIFLAAMEQYE